MAEQKNQDLNQLLKIRRDKLAELQANGKDPFQITKFNQTHHSLEVKNLYEAHEAELLKDRTEPDVTGLDEEQAKEVQKNDYEERRSIMDASPLHVAIAGRMMFKRVMGKASFCNIQDLQGNIQVYISNAVEKEIQIMVNASPDKETGGCLFGSYDRDHNSIYVYYMKPAPEDSIHTSVSFVRGFKGLTDEYKRITKLTYNQVRYLGEWHSHPNALNTPSDTDKKQFEELREEQQSQDLPFVQIIHGNNGLFVTAVM